MSKKKQQSNTDRSIGDIHQLRIARKTMTLSCIGCRCLGGPDHKQAVEIIARLTGKRIELDKDCTCK